MKKFLAVILFVIIVMSLTLSLSACNTNRADIVIWHDKEDGVIAVLQQALQSADPGFTVEFLRQSSLTDTLKIVGNDPVNAPDMFIFAHDKVGLFAEMGILEPVFNLIDESKFEGYLDVTMSAGNYKGVQYQVPLYFETLLFMYNRARMTDEQVPATTEELYQYMQANTNLQTKRYGFVEQHSTAYYSAGWIHGFGGKVLSDTGVPLLNSQQVVDALTYHKKFLQYMPGEGEYATVNTLFLEHRAHSIVAGPWLVPSAKEHNIDLGFAPMPVINQTNMPISPFLGVQGVHVLRNSAQNENKVEKIKQVLEVLSNSEVSTLLAIASGCAPSQEVCYSDSRIADDKMVLCMKETAENAIPMSNLPEMDVMFTELEKLLQDINLKGQDPLTSCNARQAEAQSLINKMK